MSYEAAIGLLISCWVTGWALGFKLRQIQDALSAV